MKYISYVKDFQVPEINVVGRESGERKKYQNRQASPAADTMTCRIPKLDINGSEVIDFFYPVDPLNCERGREDYWAYVDANQRFTISSDALKKHGKIRCDIVYFDRVSDNQLRFSKPMEIKSGDSITSDYSQVNCTAEDHKKWTNLLWTIIADDKKSREISEIEKPADWSGLNVYFIGFDSLSQMTFRRKLPKTVDYLEKELEAVVLDGYNIVGDGTPQAFIPILTGQTEEELPLTRKRYAKANYVDMVYPFVWNNFSEAGYVTLYAEDSARIGTFTYRLKGFKNKPTDHYVRTFFQRAEEFYPDINCFGFKPMHQEWLRYTREFMERYPSSVPKFLIAFHSVLSHDDVNKVEVVDDDLVSNLRTLKENGMFDNSLLIVMADHGHRFAKFRGTHQGQLEERLPFFSLALPKNFRESEQGKIAWNNLKTNKHRLTTPFDIYSTLLDIVHWPSNEELSKPGDVSQRSISLFREVPASRTCQQADIEAHWCTCLNWESAMLTDDQRNISRMLAKAVVQTINSYTNPERHLCASLKFERLENSLRLVPNDKLMKYENVVDIDGFKPKFGKKTEAAFAHYQLKFRTSPGDALYEATVKFNIQLNSITVDFTSISHVNKYGDLPHCIIDKNYFLAAYCVCYDKI